MKRKTEYLALIAVVAVLGLYLAFHRTDRTHYRLPQPAALEGNAITRIVIQEPDKELELKKTGDGWIIAPKDYPASESAVEPMLDALADLDMTALVSEGENYPSYDLDAENRIRVTAWAGDEQVRSLDIGKPAASYRHTFVKLPDDPRVYHAAGNLRNTFEKDTAALRDKTVLAFDKSRIRRIQIEKGDVKQELTLTQPEAAVEVEAGPSDEKGADAKPAAEASVWQMADGKPADQAEVGKLLGAVADLKCKGFIEGKTKADLTDPVYTLTLDGNASHTLSIYEKPDADAAAYPATASGSDYPFELAAYKAEQIMKHLLPETKAGDGKTGDSATE